MSYRRSVGIQVLLFLAVFGFAMVMALILPARVPIHWNLHGQPDGWGSKWISVIMAPALVFLNLVLTIALPKAAPQSFQGSGLKVFARVILTSAFLFAAVGVVILLASNGASFDLTRVLMALMFGFFALFGAAMHNLPRNRFAGIRTKWTLASDHVWRETHRRASVLWIIGGVAGLGLTILNASIYLSITLLLVMTFWPILLSKRLSVS